MSKEPALADLLGEDDSEKGAGKPPTLDDPEEDTPGDTGPDDGAETEVGQQMLDAVKNNDPKAMYAAMKACVDLA